jgi:oligopeptide/dipeptide ABC transporter ATP-binding protein
MTTVTTPLVLARGLTKHYSVAGGRTLHAVEDADFEIAAGETFAVVGETGSGKSTMGRLVLGLEPPTRGHVNFGDVELASLSGRDLRALRREMQPVSQDPYSALNPRMTIRKILSEPFQIHRVASGPDLDRRLTELLDLIGLPSSALSRYPHEFSGGQRQRLVIARAIALRPSFVVCDEPVSALDVSVQAQILNLLRHLQRELQLTYMIISHDLAVVRLIADHVAVMYLGRLVEVAPRDRLFEHPAHPYTQTLLAAAPVPDPTRARRHHREPPRGEATSVIGELVGCPFAARCPFVEERCRTELPLPRVIGAGHTVACHIAGDDQDIKEVQHG